MADVARSKEPRAKSPQEALKILAEGNARFYSGEPTSRAVSAFDRRLQIVNQTPFAVVLGCSDSRVPVEIVFDQGPGELFVVRVAGNVVESGVLGTIEFAVKYLNVAAILVLGHEGCGAVQAALRSPEQNAAEPAVLRSLLEQIAPAVQGVPKLTDTKARMREAVILNVKHQVQLLSANETIKAATKLGKIGVFGAFYEIGSGAVDFLD